jgi:hypothetical protein
VIVSPFTASLPLRTARRPLGVVVPVRDLRDPLTGPITLPPLPTSGPAHWHPQYDEPVYAAVYAEHREQLLAGLLCGAGEAVPS